MEKTSREKAIENVKSFIKNDEKMSEELQRMYVEAFSNVVPSNESITEEIYYKSEIKASNKVKDELEALKRKRKKKQLVKPENLLDIAYSKYPQNNNDVA